jgi:hypothetical protein
VISLCFKKAHVNVCLNYVLRAISAVLRPYLLRLVRKHRDWKPHTRQYSKNIVRSMLASERERLTPIRLCLHSRSVAGRLSAHHPAQRGATAGQAHRT